MTDAERLSEYARTGSDAAFAAVVARHRPWVLATARRLVGDPHAAEDVTQAVFLLMASKAAPLAVHPRLGGWLLRATRREAGHVRRSIARRSRRETSAAALRWQWASRGSPSAGWDRLAGVLDEQVAALRRTDREAILLRFYQSKEMADVAAALGVSEAAARKRVTRAVATLRRRLAERTGLHAAAAPLVAWLGSLGQPASPPPAAPARRPRVRPRPRLRWLALPVAAAAVAAVVVIAAQPPGRPPAPPPAAGAAPMRPASPAAAAPPPAVAPTDLTGFVCDPDGRPVANAVVTLAPWNRGEHGQKPAPDDWRRAARSDGSGAFHVRPLADLCIGTLFARADGFGMAGTQVISLSAGQAVRITLALPTALTVTLAAPDGSPAAGVPVNVVDAVRPNPDGAPQSLIPTDFRGPPFAQTTDARGRCTFTGLPRGAQVSLHTPDPRYAQFDTFNVGGDGDVHLGHEANAAVAIELHRATTLRGRVTFGPTGRPVADVGVMATPLRGDGQTQPVYTAADGTYASTQLRGGTSTVHLETQAGGWRDQHLSNDWTAYALPYVTADPGRVVPGCDLELIHSERVTGRVLDDDGQPVAGITVWPAADPLAGNEETAHVWTAAPAETDAAGRFTLRLPAGDARIMVWNPLPAGMETTERSSQRVTIIDGGETPAIELRVSRATAR